MSWTDTSVSAGEVNFRTRAASARAVAERHLQNAEKSRSGRLEARIRGETAGYVRARWNADKGVTEICRDEHGNEIPIDFMDMNVGAHRVAVSFAEKVFASLDESRRQVCLGTAMTCLLALPGNHDIKTQRENMAELRHERMIEAGAGLRAKGFADPHLGDVAGIRAKLDAMWRGIEEMEKYSSACRSERKKALLSLGVCMLRDRIPSLDAVLACKSARKGVRPVKRDVAVERAGGAGHDGVSEKGDRGVPVREKPRAARGKDRARVPRDRNRRLITGDEFLKRKAAREKDGAVHVPGRALPEGNARLAAPGENHRRAPRRAARTLQRANLDRAPAALERESDRVRRHDFQALALEGREAGSPDGDAPH